MTQQHCVSLEGSSACPAFSSASVSTNMTGQLYVYLHVKEQEDANRHGLQFFPLIRI